MFRVLKKQSTKHTLSVSGIAITVVRKDIKNMHLVVKPPDGLVRISAPRQMSDATIRSFASSKIGWIKKHIEKIRSRPPEPVLQYCNGEHHEFFGKRYVLHVIGGQGRARVELREPDCIDLFVQPDATREQRSHLLKEWCRAQLKEQIPPLLEKWEQVIGVKANQWGVKQMRTRWGTCNIAAKRIWLNLELAKKPTICLEYIIMHELTHLLERYHNRRFYALMDRFMPEWRSARDQLK